MNFFKPSIIHPMEIINYCHYELDFLMVNVKFHLRRSGICDERTEFPITETPVDFIYFIYYSKCLTLKKGVRMHWVHLGIENISDI